MKKLFILIASFGVFAASGAIKKAPDDRPVPEKKSETPRGEPEAGRLLEDLLNNLLGGGDRKLDAKLNSHYRELLEGHKPGAEAVSAATYSVRDGKKAGKPIAFATGVNAAGWLITKASEVKNAGQLQVEIRKQWVDAKVVRSWEEHDLALIKADAADIVTAKWAAAPSPGVGTFITAAAPAGREPVAIGVVSVAARSIRAKGRGFLGVQIETDDKGLKVGRLLSEGAAKAAGIKEQDRIVELDGTKPESVFGFTKSISSKNAGEKVRLKLQRGEALIDMEVSLGDLGSRNDEVGRGSQRADRMNAMGSTVSKRKGDFASVIQTDFPLDAAECGGPVTDLDGNVVGIVIARSGRIETLVLPSDIISTVLKDVDFTK